MRQEIQMGRALTFGEVAPILDLLDDSLKRTAFAISDIAIDAHRCVNNVKDTDPTVQEVRRLADLVVFDVVALTKTLTDRPSYPDSYELTNSRGGTPKSPEDAIEFVAKNVPEAYETLMKAVLEGLKLALKIVNEPNRCALIENMLGSRVLVAGDDLQKKHIAKVIDDFQAELVAKLTEEGNYSVVDA